MKPSTIMKGAIAAAVVGLVLLGVSAVIKLGDGKGSGSFACAAGSFIGAFFLLLSVAFLRSGKAFSPFKRDSGELVDRAWHPVPYWIYVGIYMATGLVLLFVTLRVLITA